MAVFNRSIDNPNGQTTIVASGAFIKGEFKLTSIFHIDGNVEGNIISDNTVVIGKSGTVKGTISSQRVVINGQFMGNINAEFIELLNGGMLSGDIVSKNLSIEVGAKFNGKSTLLDDQVIDANPAELLTSDASKDL